MVRGYAADFLFCSRVRTCRVGLGGAAALEGPAWRVGPASVSLVDLLIDVVAPLLLVTVAVCYAKRTRTLAERDRPVELWRQLAFASGLLLLFAADVPPLATIAEELVVAHMVQHLLIADLAALLIALGVTGPILQPLLATRAFSWLRVFGNPLVALPLWALNLYIWHLSALYQGVLDSSLLHLAQHAGFLTFGLAMWMPLVGPLPKPAWFTDLAMLGYIIVVRMLEAVLANVLIWSGNVLYPDYAPGEAEWDISPLADQGAAGNVMMLWTGAVTLALFTWLFIRAANRSAETQELVEFAERHGVDLDPQRAGRAVRAGQGERLRERILGGGA
jgi:putative membrane protein